MGRLEIQNDLFLAIAHPIRRAVLEELRQQETPATQLAIRFRVTPSALSQHLKALKEAGLIAEHRAGRQRIYALCPDPLREISDWIKAFSMCWPKKLGPMGDHLRRSRKL